MPAHEDQAGLSAAWAPVWPKTTQEMTAATAGMMPVRRRNSGYNRVSFHDACTFMKPRLERMRGERSLLTS